VLLCRTPQGSTIAGTRKIAAILVADTIARCRGVANSVTQLREVQRVPLLPLGIGERLNDIEGIPAPRIWTAAAIVPSRIAVMEATRTSRSGFASQTSVTV
jgi:hypothetical protein